LAKNRTPIPEDIAAAILFKQDHTCCVCQIKGKPVQIHHIDEDPSNHAPENLALLCFECHEETHIRGGFGRKLRAAEVVVYRDNWEKRVTERRARADEIAAQYQAGIQAETKPAQPETPWEPPSDLALMAYVQSLPNILTAAYDLVQPEWDKGVTSIVTQATYQVISVVEQMWVQLARWYPPNHFGQKPAAQFFSDFIASRFEFRYALIEPEGARTGGTMIRPMVAYGVLLDAVETILLTIELLFISKAPDFNLEQWKKRWRAAYER
jgi:hypothetical protein